ncbi:enoyl-CoA hydratase-related protein [Ruixingdingia sedimenti]|uniref:Enoyl-CoA hydratase-related protein n=1 Tax=Ruixingdingia sedimenti TaxID=3073604 RepID=A0ABU1FA20_9RHOB|nr:enoyl-CoA hydratase-related protein [Xinfangfangia sp. LG-4]MDR5653730.1 enoyl-CoA hydratase-related protein [Xinfangfangia sp. LG-4]
MTDQDAPVLTRFDPATGIGRLVLNRPAVLNAADATLAMGVREAVRYFAGVDGLRCLVLTGAGRAFMAGGDVASFAADPAQTETVMHAILDAMNPAVLALRDLPAPILAAPHGVAAGAGFSLVLAADIVIAQAGTKFLMAYDRIGTVPDCGGSWFLPRKVGMGRAAEMMVLSHTLTAEQAQDWGIVNRIAPADGFAAAVDALAAQLAQGPGRAFAAGRKLLDAAFGASLAEHLEAERNGFIAMTRTADFREGTGAFLAKRPPAFTGR